MHYEVWALNTGNLVGDFDFEFEALTVVRDLLAVGWSIDDLGLRLEYDDGEEDDDALLPPSLYGAALSTRLAEGPDRGIERTSGVVGGSARVVHTRIPVWLLEQAHRLGLNYRDILSAYPSLRLEDVMNAWGYAREHAEEIDRELMESEAGEIA